MAYILAADPQKDTMYDFWRMIVDQDIKTVIMLSADGEGDEDIYGIAPCPQYWPDDAQITHDNLSINRDHIRTLPLYIQRDFSVVNTKVSTRTLCVEKCLAVNQFLEIFGFG